MIRVGSTQCCFCSHLSIVTVGLQRRRNHIGNGLLFGLLYPPFCLSCRTSRDLWLGTRARLPISPYKAVLFQVLVGRAGLVGACAPGREPSKNANVSSGHTVSTTVFSTKAAATRPSPSGNGSATRGCQWFEPASSNGSSNVYENTFLHTSPVCPRRTDDGTAAIVPPGDT
jgi:hypothetical protein